MKRWLLTLVLLALACSNATEPQPDASAKRVVAAAGAVTLTPASIASLVGDKDTIVGTASCLLAWRMLDSTKVKLVSTFKGPGQTKTNSAVIQSLAAGTTGVRGGCNGAADTTAFTITDPQPPPPPPPGDSVGVQAAMADSFVKTTSVQGHFGTNGVYTNNFATLRSRLLELGVRHLRQRVDVINATAQAQLAELGDSGITLAAGCWPQGTNYTSAAHCIPDLNAIGISRIYAVDGWNEVDLKLTSWTGPYVQFQTALFNAIHGDPTWANTPVFAHSLGNKGSPLSLSNISGIIDFGNMHPYPGGASLPSSVSTGWIPNWNTIASPKPLVATETGYHTCPACTNGVGVSELAQAKYLPRIYTEYWNRGVRMTSLYELVDEGDAGSTATREDHWGLLHNDMTRKPSFNAIRDMLALLKDPGANFTPGKLNYTLTNALGTTHSFLVQKRSGVFFLVIWQDLNVYNTTTETDTSNPADALTVTLGRSRPWKTYLPRTGGTTVQASGTGTTINLNVPDEVMIVEIDP